VAAHRVGLCPRRQPCRSCRCPRSDALGAVRAARTAQVFGTLALVGLAVSFIGYELTAYAFCVA
jgi:hypothetical protein